MTDINSLVLVGRITKDVGARDFSYTQSGTAKLETGIAVNLSSKKNGQWVDEASFFNLTLWGKTAENLRQYLTKGQQVAVQGHLQQQRWTDNTGKNQSRIAIVTDNIQLIGSKGNGGNQQSAPASQNESYSSPDNYDEDIPF